MPGERMLRRRFLLWRVVAPVTGHILAGIGAGIRMLHRVRVTLVEWTDIVFPEGQSGSGADQAGRPLIEVQAPIFLGVEQCAVIDAYHFVDEYVTLLDEIRPDRSNT